jgi:hypothetical protein
MSTIFPTSPAAGVYVNENGLVPDDAGLTVPDPFAVIVTLVALPPNVLPLTTTEFVLQPVPLVLLKVTVGGLAHPHDT